MEYVPYIWEHYGVAGVVIFLLGKELWIQRKKRSGKWVGYDMIVNRLDALKKDFQDHKTTDEVFMAEQKQINSHLEDNILQLRKTADRVETGVSDIKNLLIARGGK